MNINELFALSKSYYKKSQTPDIFYISTFSKYGVHLGVYPDPVQVRYSEYIFGDPIDMVKIAESAIKYNIFKSFYCNLCTIQEKDNYYEINDCNILEQKENLAFLINKKVIFGKIPFLISGTSPQYYYNHLLLSTEEHYSTYMIFENFNLFRGVYKFTENICRQNNSCKLIFNGNFGSDIWHFHAHITDQAIGYIDQYNNMSNNNFSDINSNYGIVKYKLLVSSNLSELYKYANYYTSIIYSDEYYSKRKYLSAAFKVLNISENKRVYLLFLISGNKLNSVNYKNNNFYMILPSAVLNVSNMPIDIKDLENIVGLFGKQNSYLDWNQIKHVERNENLPIVENFEKIFKKNCLVLNEVIKTKAFVDTFNIVDKCLIYGCKKEEQIFASYKYIISVMFICLCVKSQRTNKKINKVVAQVYKKMMSDPRFLAHIVKAGIAYLTTTFGIENTRSLFLQGPVASMIYEKSLKNFNLATSTNITLSTDIFAKQTNQINQWINYKKELIGAESATGSVVTSSISYNPKIDFVIKINKNPSSMSRSLFIYEFSVGTKLNNLRQKIPNFLLTLDGFSCLNDKSLNTLCMGNSQNGQETEFIVLEKIFGKTFASYISQSEVTLNNILLGIQQISLALLYSQKKEDFTHYDLHIENILATPLPTSLLYSYLINGNKFDVEAFANFTIIDYGMSHVKGLKQYLTLSPAQSTKYGMTPQYPYFNRDLYSLLINTFFYCCIFKPTRELFRSLIGFLIKTLIESYSDIFIPNAFNYLKKNIDSLNFNMLPYFEKASELVKIFNYIRKGNYYLYLPTSYPFPKNGIYSSMENFVTFLNSKIINTDNLPIYKWGDYEQTGCISTKRLQNKSFIISNIKNIIK
jgi:hypothetical protein